jgi:hypothetical protein
VRCTAELKQLGEIEPRNHRWSRAVARLQLVTIRETKSPSAPPCGRLWVAVDRLGPCGASLRHYRDAGGDWGPGR